MSTTAGAFVAGGIAACGAVTVTHGFETVKIRLQLQGELQSKQEAKRLYKGVLHGYSVIVKNEGVRGLLRGLSCAYIYQIALNGCRLGFYEPIRASVAGAIYKDPTVQSIGVNIFSGASSGILGAMAGSPFFLVKTRLQSYSPFLPVGTQHQYRSPWDGLGKIYSSEGFKGLYRGVGPAMIRTGFGSSVQLPTYFLAKRTLMKHFGVQDGTPLHLASSTASGFVVCCVMHPPDTVMSRMYNQTGNLYSSAFDCLYRTVKTEGLLAVYKGYFAHLARILPHTILTLTLAEQTNKLMRKFEDQVLPSRRKENL
ncbi:mitochondrial carrier protein [Eremomyces bilateralis CBS 781.70]|uniref:Mitochondrial carrier protein n=1 Tax=Eremomyces bilateralis CBS 781.70 TaxID=1392243 RepID=A0A6G1GAQ3_9PEZI|nr:mitochondrial carrier protein [Eremomyces bilateralis CBS 781.70]KAF1814980.1 mitochondrial carrier protein [Eremomyces bilateralis CBS 781.70]